MRCRYTYRPSVTFEETKLAGPSSKVLEAVFQAGFLVASIASMDVS